MANSCNESKVYKEKTCYPLIATNEIELRLLILLIIARSTAIFLFERLRRDFIVLYNNGHILI